LKPQDVLRNFQSHSTHPTKPIPHALNHKSTARIHPNPPQNISIQIHHLLISTSQKAKLKLSYYKFLISLLSMKRRRRRRISIVQRKQATDVSVKSKFVFFIFQVLPKKKSLYERDIKKSPKEAKTTAKEILNNREN
jgi:hypothetical protein